MSVIVVEALSWARREDLYAAASLTSVRAQGATAQRTVLVTEVICLVPLRIYRRGSWVSPGVCRTVSPALLWGCGKVQLHWAGSSEQGWECER